MKVNMGAFDRIVRILAAIAIVILYFTNQLPGISGIISLIIAGILMVTSFVGFCPLYFPFKISTLKKKT